MDYTDRTVAFRAFEERDVDFVLKCKNDEDLNSLVVGQTKKINYQQAVDWVHGCMIDNPTFKFWAVCANNDEKQIVGWTAINKIDDVNQSAYFYSIIIGNPKYRNGIPWVEIQQFVISYVFEILKLNRLEYSCLTEHPSSMSIGPIWFFEQEGLKRNAVFKRGRFYDVAEFALLREEYVKHRDAGEYEFSSLLSRYAIFSRKKQN